MSNRCSHCGKKSGSGHLVSHSNHKTKRKFKPNIQLKNLFNSQTGKFERIKACTRCLKTLVRKIA